MGMTTRLLVVDCDGTLSSIDNPFYTVARELSCYQPIKAYAEEYLTGSISYEELVQRQNPVFREAGRKYANELGYAKLGLDLFLGVLKRLFGENYVLPEMIEFLDTIRNCGYQIAMVSSGWEVLVAKAAMEAKIQYWRANTLLFLDNEFAGTSVRVPGDKTTEFESAVRAFGVGYGDVIYFGDNEFDLIAMDFIHRKGGECVVRKSGDSTHVRFPQHVRQFVSLFQMAEYLRSGMKQ
jgi:phosphoserine phosphatase